MVFKFYIVSIFCWDIIYMIYTNLKTATWRIYKPVPTIHIREKTFPTQDILVLTNMPFPSSGLLSYYWPITYEGLRCTMRWFDRLLFPHIITVHVCVCVVITFKIYSLNDFQVYSTVNYSRQIIRWLLRAYSSYGWEFVPFNQHLPISPPRLHPTLAAIILLSPSMSSASLDSECEWEHAVFAFLWFISLSIMPSRSIHVVIKGRVFFNGWITSHCMCMFVHIWNIWKLTFSWDT